MVKGEKVFHNNSDKGVACIGGTNLEDVWGWTRISWPDGLLEKITDEKGRAFGCKSTTLESVGLLLPLLAFPKMVAGKHLVLKIDNTAVLWGWHNGYVKHDESASEVLRSAFYLAGYLGATIHVEHVARVSDELATLADEMSRRKTSRCAVGRLALEKAIYREVGGCLLRWLEDPCYRGNLCTDILKEVTGPS